MRRQFNRALRGGSDSESDEEEYVYSEEEEEEDTRTPIEIIRKKLRDRYRQEKEEDERRDRMRKRGPLMERMRKRDKVTNALWTISNNHYNWKEERPLWTKGGKVTNVYVNLALDEMTIDMFAEKLVEKYPDDEVRRKNVIKDVQAKVRAWKKKGGYPPKLSDAWYSL